MGDGLLVGGVDLSGDIGSLERIGGGPNPLPATGINAFGMERIGGIRDGAMDFSAWFNPAVGQAHPTLSALPTANVIATYIHGSVLANPTASIVAKQVNYDGDRGTDGSLSFSVQELANGYALEWGDQLTAGIDRHTGATNGVSVDYTAASTAFGWQAYLQVTGFNGTDCTITLQDSANNTDFAPFTASAFTQVTVAPTSQRIQGARDAVVRRYVRVATTGTFTTIDLMVMFVKNLVAVNF
jgi:hypothetical protein